MERTEIAVWRVAGAEPATGKVVKRTKSNIRTVRWDDEGHAPREQRIEPKSSTVRFAYEDTRKLKWLLDPDGLEAQFKANPEEIFVAVLQDLREPATGRTIQAEVASAGVDQVAVRRAWDSAKPRLEKHRHIELIKPGKFAWSDEPVDPYAALKRLTPEEALQKLLKGGISAEIKNVLADVIRSGFRT